MEQTLIIFIWAADNNLSQHWLVLVLLILCLRFRYINFLSFSIFQTLCPFFNSMKLSHIILKVLMLRKARILLWNFIGKIDQPHFNFEIKSFFVLHLMESASNVNWCFLVWFLKSEEQMKINGIEFKGYDFTICEFVTWY